MKFRDFMVVAQLAIASVCFAGGGGGNDEPPESNFNKAKRLIETERFAEAIPVLNTVVEGDRKNADALNYLGFAHRKLGKTDDALRFYGQALALKPEHLGANEYLGELYVQLGDVKKAQGRLDVLQKACGGTCEEYTELKEKIAEYKKAHP